MRLSQTARVVGVGLLALVATGLAAARFGPRAWSLGLPWCCWARPGSTAVAVGSAAMFGVGFTTGFALLVMWSQRVFSDRPTTGFTLDILFIAAGFIIGPSLFGVLAAHVGRPAALLATAAPALLVALVPPARDDRIEVNDSDEHDDAVSAGH